MFAILPFAWSLVLGLSIYSLGEAAALPWALLGMVLLLLRLRHGEISLLTSWAWGALFYVFAVPWVPEAFHRFAHLPERAAYLATALIFLVQGLEIPFLVLLLRGFRFLPRALALPLAWFALESLIPRFLPWSLSAAFLDVPFLRAQGALFGAAGFSACLLMLAELLFTALADWNRRALFCFLLLGTFVAGYGFYWEQQERPTTSLDVAILQANLREVEEWTSLRGVEKLRRMTSELLEEKRKPELIVWPESAIARSFRLGEKEIVIGTDRDPFPGLDIPLLFGAQTKLEPIFPPRNTFGVSALLLLPQGQIGGHYLKQRLFPFSEEIPLAHIFPWLNRFHPREYDTASQASDKIMKLPLGNGREVSIEVNICYEDLYAESFASTGVGLDIVILNDVWFSGMKTALQHETLSRLRALEFGRPLLRVSNSGITALINGKAEHVFRFPEDVEEKQIVAIPYEREDRQTFYAATKVFQRWAAVIVAVIGFVFFLKGCFSRSHFAN